VTSRAEPQITRALSSFTPKELLAYEAKNRADVEVYLRTIAPAHQRRGEHPPLLRLLSSASMTSLHSLQKPMEISKAIDANVREKVSA